MAHRLAPALQFFLFAFCESGVGQLVKLKLQEVLVLAVTLYAVLQLCQAAFCLLIAGERLLIGFQLLGVLSENVNHVELKILLSQQQVLVLRMDVDQLLAELLEQSQRHGRVVDEGAAFARRHQFPAHDRVGSILFDVVFVEKVGHWIARQVEMRLDDALFGSLLDAFRVGSLSQQQADGAEHDALACTRLAGNHRKTFAELDVELRNQRKILNI